MFTDLIIFYISRYFERKITKNGARRLFLTLYEARMWRYVDISVVDTK